MDDELRRLLVKLIRNDNERHIAEFLDKIELKFVAANSRFYDDAHKPTNEIDLIFTYQKRIFVIEVSADTSKVNRQKKRKKLREWEIKKNQIRLAEKHELNKQNPMYVVYIDLSRDKIAEGKEPPSHPNSKTIIIYKQELRLAGNLDGVKTAKEFLDLIVKKAEKIGKSRVN